jgi:hypothetical protein
MLIHAGGRVTIEPISRCVNVARHTRLGTGTDHSWREFKLNRAQGESSMENSRIAPGMQVLTSDGEYIGNVDNPSDDGFTLRRLTGSDGEHERVPSLWVHRVDEHIHLNRTGAEAIAGWKSLKFQTSSGTAPAQAATAEKRSGTGGFDLKWILWAALAVVVILVLMMLF